MARDSDKHSDSNSGFELKIILSVHSWAPSNCNLLGGQFARAMGYLQVLNFWQHEFFCSHQGAVLRWKKIWSTMAGLLNSATAWYSIG